ncbi:C40 family peptidase [Blastococcus jejuensis]|uniref:C40 family peptidase n=1 Tax=Blastococcus jejuensis TaxID=351224 RepID=A0ABP6PMP3_9ACTN
MQLTRSTTRRRSRAVLALGAALVATATGVLSPTVASAEPGTAAEAMAQVRQAAQELTVIDEQVHQAEVTVAEQRATADAAAAAAAEAQRAVDAYEPQLRAIAHSGFTGENQSRVAAFLTSDSATELVQQMTTLDLIAAHTNEIIAQVAALQDAAEQAQAVAAEAAARAEAGLTELQAQQAEVQERVQQYQADFARLSAAEQAAVATAIAGPALAVPSVDALPLAPGSAAAIAIGAALAKVGSPYVWGSSGPTGFDCSGLTSYAYRAAGVALPHSSRAQSSLGRQVSRSELQPGDLVFFYSPISHVGLYIGNGMMVHARTFGQPVAVTSVDQAGYRFATRIVG